MINDDDAILISRALDGDLSGAEETAFKERLLSDPEFREVYETLRINHEMLGELTSKIDTEPMPETLLDENAVTGSINSRFRFRAMAAAVAAIAIGTITLLNQNESPTLAEVLNSLPSGESIEFDEGNIEVIATFRSNDAWCREYVTGSEHAVACRLGSNWQTQVSQVTGTLNPENFSPAGSSDLVQQFVIDNIDGQTLSAQEEKDQLKEWQ